MNVFAATMDRAHRGRRAVILVLLLGAALAPCLDWLLPNSSGLLPLPGYTVSGPVIGDSAWRENAEPSSEPASRYRRLANRGSFVAGDGFTGEHVTGWYRAAPRVLVLVTGGPNRPGNQLAAEIHRADDRIETMVFDGTEPGEAWAPWIFSLPADAVAFRLHGRDGNTGFRGWLGFSEPCALSAGQTVSWKMTAQVLCSVALAVVLVLGPGLTYGARRNQGPGWAVLWLGPVLLAAGGAACWLLGGLASLRLVASVWVGGTLLAVAFMLWRHRAWRLWTGAEATVLALVPLCVLGAAAKASFSGGPEGELYHGLMSRTLEASGHSDSRISYHTVQLVANHLTPYEPEGQKYFSPWSFSSRGPLAGLAAAPVVLATGGIPPLAMPDEAWEPFDRGSFAAYRITLATLGALGLWAVFGLLRLVADEKRALVGAGLLALAPFFWHELYFSWPKPVTAAWVIGAFALLWQRRFFAGGLVLGTAYLWHPLALLSAPFLALWCLVAPGTDRRRGFYHAAIFGSGIVLIVAGWLAANYGHNAQAGFIRYFTTADEGPATLRTWPLSRWNNFANTLIPFYVWLVNADHPAYGAFGIRSNPWLLFFRQYWTAAPFAVGLVAWLALLPAFLRGLLRHPGLALLCVIGPFLFLTVYWGGAATGLMREAGQPLFLAGWIFLAWSGAMPAWSRQVIAIFCTARAAEVLAMMFVPTLVPASRHFSSEYFLNDCLWLGVAVAVVVVAAGMAWRMLVIGTVGAGDDPELRSRGRV